MWGHELLQTHFWARAAQSKDGQRSSGRTLRFGSLDRFYVVEHAGLPPARFLVKWRFQRGRFFHKGTGCLSSDRPKVVDFWLVRAALCMLDRNLACGVGPAKLHFAIQGPAIPKGMECASDLGSVQLALGRTPFQKVGWG